MISLFIKILLNVNLCCKKLQRLKVLKTIGLEFSLKKFDKNIIGFEESVRTIECKNVKRENEGEAILLPSRP